MSCRDSCGVRRSWLALVLAIALGRGIATGTEPLQEIFVDDFEGEPKHPYRTTGAIRRESGRVLLSAGSSLELSARFGQEADLELDLDWSELGVDDGPGVTQIVIRSENNELYAAAILVDRSLPDDKCQLFFLDLSPGPDGTDKPTPIAGHFSVPIEKIDGVWSLRWRFGHIELWRGNQRVAQSYFHALASPMSGVRIVQIRGDIRCDRLRLSASQADAPWSAEQERIWRDAETAERRVHEHWAAGRMQEARGAAEEVRRLREAVTGLNHPDVALASLNLATLLFRTGDYIDSRKRAELALRALEARLGECHPLSALAHERVGEACREMDDLKSAAAHFSESLRVRELTLGSRHPQVADSHTNLGQLALCKCDYATARREFEHSLAIRRDTAGESSASSAQGYNDLGMTLLLQGDIGAASEMLVHALEIRRQVLPERHFEIALSLNNLALARREAGDLQRARELWLAAARSLDGVLPSDHPLALTVSENLAVIDAQQGNWREARKRLNELVVSSRRKLGGDNRRTAVLRFHLGIVLAALGEVDGAKAEWQAAEAWAERNVGHADRQALHVMFNKAIRLKLNGEEQAARDLFHTLFDQHLNLSFTTLVTLSEAEMFAFTDSIIQRRDQYLWTLRTQRDEQAAAAYDAVWKTKSVATRLLGLRKVLQSQSEETRRRLAELRELKTQLGNASYEADRDDSPADRRKLIAELTRRKEQAERRLHLDIPGLHLEFGDSKPRFSELMEQLPDGVAVVDIVKVRDWDANPPPGQPANARDCYEAFVLVGGTRKSVPTWVHLGAANTIDRAVQGWRASLTDSQRGDSTKGVSERSHQVDDSVSLRRVVWEPIERQLGSARVVVIIPDGALTALPWAALPGANPGTFLLDDYAFGTVIHARQLLESQQNHGDVNPAGVLAIGISEFEAAAPIRDREDSPGAEARRGESSVVGRRKWSRLDGAARQAASIQGYVQGPVKILLDLQAEKKLVLEQLSKSRFAVLATHGFYESDLGPATDDLPGRTTFSFDAVGDDAFGDLTTLPRARNPLLFCGLVFAGGEIATGEELSELDLQGVDHVMLMACDTGSGEVVAGEGAQSLQRCLTLAGARNVVASLWKVNDSVAEDFSHRYLQNLEAAAQPPLIALRNAQLSQRRGLGPGVSDNPRFWAPWTVSVDARTIRAAALGMSSASEANHTEATRAHSTEATGQQPNLEALLATILVVCAILLCLSVIASSGRN